MCMFMNTWTLYGAANFKLSCIFVFHCKAIHVGSFPSEVLMQYSELRWILPVDILYGRPYQSKVVWVHNWWSRNRSLWLSLSIGDWKCRSLWLRLSIGDWDYRSLWLSLSISDWKCRSLWLRLSIADWVTRSLWSKKRLNIKTNDCYGREKDWCLKTIIQRLMIQNVYRYDREWKGLIVSEG